MLFGLKLARQGDIDALCEKVDLLLARFDSLSERVLDSLEAHGKLISLVDEVKQFSDSAKKCEIASKTKRGRKRKGS